MADDLNNTLDNMINVAENKAQPRTQRSNNTYVGGAIASTLSATAEVFGSPAMESAQEFRNENPVAGTATQFGGTLLPYLATASAKNKVKAFDDAVESFAERGANELTRGARRGVATFAPLEAARITGTAIQSPEDIGQVLQESAFNLATEAVGGAFLGALKSGGMVDIPKPTNPVGSDLRTPAQLKLRKLNEQLANAELDDAARIPLKRQAVELEQEIRLEGIDKHKVSFDFVDGKGQQVARLFGDSSSPKGHVRRSKLVMSGKGFSDMTEVNNVIKKAGLEGNLDAASLPRHISFGSKNGATRVQTDLLKTGKMKAFDDNTLMNKTKDGTFVMARKITGSLDEAAPTDEWVVWRTAQPGRFNPEIKEFADAMNERMLFLRNGDRFSPTGSSIMDQANRSIKDSPLYEFRDLEEKLGLLKAGSDKIAEKFGYKPGAIGSSFAAQRGKAFVEQYLTPALHNFKESPLASYVWGHARHIHDISNYQKQKMLFGEAVTPAAKGFGKFFAEPSSAGKFKLADGSEVRSIDKILKSMSNEDIAKFHEVAELVAGTDDAVKGIDDLYTSGEISKELYTGLRDLNRIDADMVGQIRATQRAAGVNELNPLEGHLMLSRVWDGDYRAIISNNAGEVVYVAAGRTPKLADAKAQAVIKESGLDNLKYMQAEKVDSMQDFKLSDLIKTNSREYQLLAKSNANIVRNPQTFKERTGVGGYKTEFTRDELFDRIRSHISERQDHMADLTVTTSLDQELFELMENDPKLFNTMQMRLRQLSEKPGGIGRVVNEATDKLLKPVLGRNSATKISATVNEFLYHTQLGMGNLAFPVLNAMTFAQTVFPELSYVVNAADNRVIRDYYEVAILGGSDLKPRGHIHKLSMPKLMMQSVKKMGSSDDAVFEAAKDRALREGVIDPQLMAEFIGKTSETQTTLTDVLKGDESMSSFIKSISTWLPNKSERFARGHAFTIGHLMGQDVLGLQDEALYQFAKKFTQRTMYNYGTADRAAIMTGPVGRTFGLFKNWQTHYIFSMMQYGNEAVKYGNWKPLLWQMGGTASVGGVSALPLYGAADSFSKMATNESLMTHIYEAFGGTNPDGTLGTTSDAVLMGLPAFMGITLTGSASAPFSDPARDAAQLASFPQWDRMVQLGTAVGDAIDAFGKTGQHPIQNEAVRDKFIAALSPKAIARSFQLTNEGALKSLNTGNVTLNDLNLAERLLWSAGFTPRRVGVTYEAADELWRDQEKRRTQTSKYGKLWQEAQAEQDWDTLWNLQQQAMVLGLDLSSIARSADAYGSKKNEEMISRQFSPESRAKLQSLGLPGF